MSSILGNSSKKISSDNSLLSAAVGIDDMAVYIPSLYLPLTGEFSRQRDIDPEKLTRGIGVERMAVPDAHEDAATMAAMSLLELMRRCDLQPGDIGKIYLGTESAVDEAKAMGTYVIGMLERVYGSGSFQGCSTVEFKSACIGTTLALESISYWVAAGEDERIGVVIATDVARYPLHSPGEYTQGAGSVSLLVKRDPRIAALEQIYGCFTRDENDFFRPLGCATATVNGKHSNQCYLDAMQGAFASYAAQAAQKGLIAPKRGECTTDWIEHLLFHIPYPRMVEYASAAILRQDWRNSRHWKNVEAEIGVEPEPQNYADLEKYQIDLAGYARSFARSRYFQQAYNAKVKDSAALSRQVGNIYTGSIYLGLASLLELRKVQAKERLCFGAYGSGCSALVFSARAMPGISSVPSRGLFERLERRREISLQEYELLHEGEGKESLNRPSEEFVLARIDHQGYRHYEYVR